MKHLIFSMAASAVLAFTACNTNSNKATEVKPVNKDTASSVPAAQAVYACPMHPEVTGNKGDKCPKCGMELTEVQKTPGSAPASSATGR